MADDHDWRYASFFCIPAWCGCAQLITSLLRRNTFLETHYLELVDVRRALLTSGILRKWVGDVELRSINYSISYPLAKDYDAVADLELNGKIHRVAIEYERTLKSAERYRELSATLNSEDQISMLIYLTSSMDLLHQIYGQFDVGVMAVAIAFFTRDRAPIELSFLSVRSCCARSNDLSFW